MLVGTSWYFYAQHRLLIDFTYPLMSTTAIYLTLIFSSFVREQAQRRQIRSAFGQYLSPALVEQLAQSPEKLVLGGEEREMTIMFSDVRGFTTISETYKDDPQGLTALMNRFLTPLTNAIIDRKGTIDKYMGDADHGVLERAARRQGPSSSMPARQRSTCWSASTSSTSEREAGGEGRWRAVHSDQCRRRHQYRPCVVGNMGSDLRFDYSVLGDSVNLASRLEGQSQRIRLSDHHRLARPRSRSRTSSRSSSSTSSW